MTYTWRSIASMPLLATVIVVSLGLGIGANTVVFSWVQARVLRPIPGVKDGASFRLIEPRTVGGLYPGVSWPEYRDLRERLQSFEAVVAFRMAPLYVGEPGKVERVFGLLVSDNYFDALGLRPALGRFFDRGEVARPGAEPVAVVSYGVWQLRFNGAADALGRTVRVNGRDLTVVGVAPRGFQGTVLGLDFEVWLPATLAPLVTTGSRELESRMARGYAAMGKLRPSVTRAQAQSELDIAMRQLAHAYPESNAAIGGEVLPFSQSPRGPQRMLNAALMILQGLMLLLLVAVCGNTANLVLARASARQREMGVRLALGAGPWRIARLLLAENVVLGVIGAALGALAAVWGAKALMLLPMTGLPIRFQTSVDATGLAFAMLLGIGCGLLVGAAPAAQLARADPQIVVRTGLRTAGRSALRNTLMGVQVALALVVLIVAGLFFRSFMETRDTDPGFRREGVTLAAYDLAGRGVPVSFARGLALRIVDRVRALPGVESAAIASSVPLDIHGLPSRVFTLEGRTRTEEGYDEALTNSVTPDYFRVLGIPLLAGRDFVPLSDTQAPPQAIVNEAFVRRFVTTGEAIGRQLQARGGRYTIVGVVATSLYNAFGEPPTPIIYFSYRDSPQGRGEIHVRTTNSAPAAVGAEVRRVVRELDPELPVFNVRTLTDHVETNLIFRRIPARMFAVLGPLLLLLAALGIYASVAYTMSLRTTEIGVRLAVGANVPGLVAQFVGESLAVIGLGALAGWVLAFVVAADLAPAGTLDLSVFAGVPAILLTVGAFASWLPARRATRIDPVVALRNE